MFFERHRGGERAVLVQLQLEGAERDLSLIEFEELVVSAGGNPVAALSGSRRVPHARTFVGEGKLEEIAAKCREHEAELVIFNHALSPSQERNLEQVLGHGVDQHQQPSLRAHATRLVPALIYDAARHPPREDGAHQDGDGRRIEGVRKGELGEEGCLKFCM